MLQNYIKVALRNLKRHKTFSIINIAGLSVSLALVILIATYTQFEMSIDKFHENYYRIYKVGKDYTPAPVADVIKSNVPEIKKAARIEFFRTRSVTITSSRWRLLRTARETPNSLIAASIISRADAAGSKG